MKELLKIEGLEAGYGSLLVLSDVSLHVDEGELVTVIGSNGSGKTTLLRTIAGLLPVRRGEIRYRGERINDIPPNERVKLGMVYIPEGRRPFPYLTVRENLEMGAFNPRARKRMKENLEMVYEIFPVLRERENQMAITLSGGEQQMLAIGRGLMSMADFIMLDEPSLGLAPKLVSSVLDVVDRLHREHGITFLLVEQNAVMALKLADRAYVLENGRIVLEGSGDELMRDERVKRAYLGI